MARIATIQVGDEGVRLMVDMGANVTQATLIAPAAAPEILYKKPDGSEGAWEIDGIIDGTKFLYTTATGASDLDQAGVWILQPQFTLGDWVGRGAQVKLRVKERIYGT